MENNIGNRGERATSTQGNIFEFKRIYNLVSDKYGGSTTSVLDYGCGSGYGTYILSKRFGHVMGVDVNAAAINYCNENYSNENLEYKLLDPDSQPFENNHFDNIFSFQVFEHIALEKARGYLSNIWNMLKPGGVAIVTTPNSNNYYGGHSGNEFHFKEYTKAELEKLLSDVIPSNKFTIYFAEDIFSTRVRIQIKKLFKNHVAARIFSKALELVLKIFERKNIISTDYKKMLKKKNIDKIIGSFYIIIEKK